MMKKLNLAFTTFLLISVFSHYASAQTEKLDDLAACAGIVLGNGAVDFILGDEESFDITAHIAYTAYLSEAFTGGYQPDDLQVADQILGANVDKITILYNNGNFDEAVYEEVVVCYRKITTQLMEGAEFIISNQSKWSEVKNKTIANLKRILNAA